MGGGVTGKHDALVRLLARLLRAAGYQVASDGPGTWEPRWDRPVLDAHGTQKRDADGNFLWEHARLDLRLEGGPEEPTTYGDGVVSQARANSWARLGAAADEAVAAGGGAGRQAGGFRGGGRGALGPRREGLPLESRRAGLGAAPRLG